MKYCLILFTGLMLSCSAMAQHVGVNIATPEMALDINGDIGLRSAELTLVEGDNIAVDVNSNPFSNYRIIGPTQPFTISGISYSPDGRMVLFFNRSGQTLTIANESVTAAESERIITGSGADITIPNNASIQFQYDGGAMRWVVRSQSPTAGSAIAGGWALNGNLGLANTNFIGTTDNIPLVLKQNNTEVARYSGTNAFILGKYRAPLTSSSYSVAIGTDAEISGDNQIIIGAPYHKTGVGLGYNESPDHTLTVGRKYSNAGALGIYGTGGFHTHFNYGNTEDTYIRAGKLLGRVFINNNNGGDVILGSETTSNVGIGTNYAPSRRLEVYKGRMLFRGAQDVANNIYPGIEFSDGVGNVLRGFVGMANDNLVGFYGYQGGGFGMVMDVTSGNVGIGTTNPTYKLSVNGFIRSKEIVVESNWADYVFEDNYALLPLDSMQHFILQNKHLPGMPTSQEVQTNGLSMAAMQTRMMEKIEEQSLYILQLHERLNTLEKLIHKTSN
ncbi:MAG: hypothetical protein ACOYKE_08210 [Ferruginibacter sp.]